MGSQGQIERLFEGVSRFWGGLSAGNRIALGTLLIFLGLAGAYAFSMGTSEDMLVAFHNLEPADASQITAVLDANQIPYEAMAGGSVIKVPETLHSAALLAAGGEGLLAEGVGYEIFDEPSFSRTKDEFKVQHRRALEGELRRTIVSLSEVRNARVHVVMPRESLLLENRRPGSVSIALSVASGKQLSEVQVRGIVNLVAASVEGLTPEQVTVVDQDGKTLSSPGDPLMAGSEGVMKQRAQLEKVMERKILTLLEPITGTSNVRVRVAADVDFHKEELVDESFVGEAVAQAEKTHSERRSDAEAQAEGVPGAQANGAGAGGGGGPLEKGETGTEERSVTYMVPNQTRRIERTRTEIKKIGVAVLINGTLTPGAEGEEPVYTARSEEELAKIEALVKGAMGFDEKRGDAVVVSEMAFSTTTAAPIGDPGFSMTPDMWRAVRYAVVLTLAMMLLIFLVRPLVKAVTRAAPAKPTAAERAAEPGAESRQESGDKQAGSMDSDVADKGFEAPGENTRVLAMDYANDDPRKTAQILRVWLLEDAGEGVTLPDMGAEQSAQVPEAARA